MTGAQKTTTAILVAITVAGFFLGSVYLRGEQEINALKIKAQKTIQIQKIQSEERLEMIRLITG